MKIEIRRTKNGSILRIEEDGEEVSEIIYQEMEGADIEAFADLLRYLMDNYGPTTSRYSPTWSRQKTLRTPWRSPA